jgi:uridine kinase
MTVLVAITGGSGSGKSTLAAALLAALVPGAGVLISEDWYYRNVPPGVDPASHDFDDVTARDHALLVEHLIALKAGHAITAPSYCFIRHARQPEGSAVAAAEVVILEGAHLLCDPALAALFDLKIYLDTPSDVRFIRRLMRDQSERGRSVSSVVSQYLATVRPAHERLTGPSQRHADIVLIDASPAVAEPDPAVIRRLAEPVLRHPVLKGFVRAGLLQEERDRF